MKPIDYFFNGHWHTMSSAERFAIEVLGPRVEALRPPPHTTLFEAAAIMQARPGETEPTGEVIRSKSDRSPLWHMYGGCGRWTDSSKLLQKQSFSSNFNLFPDVCCGSCARMIRDRVEVRKLGAPMLT